MIKLIFMWIKKHLLFVLIIGLSSCCYCQQDYQVETFVLFNNITAENVIMDNSEILKTDSLTIHSNSIFNISSFRMKIYKFSYLEKDSLTFFKEEEFFSFKSNSNKITSEMKSVLADYSCISKFVLYDFEIENKKGEIVKTKLLYPSINIHIVMTN